MNFIFAIIILATINFSFDTNTINQYDNIPDDDEFLIKNFRAHHDYSAIELKFLDIKFLGEVDGYRIYYVPNKNDTSYDQDDWKVGKLVFPSKCHTRIVGIKNNKLSVIGELLNEIKINAQKLYNIIPKELMN